MTLPASGPISVSQINTEIGYIPANGNIWFSHEWMRNLAQRPSGAISMSDFRGKASYVPMRCVSSGVDYWEPNPNTSSINNYDAYCYMDVYNGKGPFTYSWAWQNGNSGGMTLLNTDSSSCITRLRTRFSASASGVLQCTITDTYNGAQVTIYDIGVYMTVGQQN